MIALRNRQTSERQVKLIDLILTYFWITAILHYPFSLLYYVDCIIPYTNYFLPVGALDTAGLLGGLFRLTRGPRRRRPWRVRAGIALFHPDRPVLACIYRFGVSIPVISVSLEQRNVKSRSNAL